MNFRLSQYHVATDILPDKDGAVPTRLLFATRTGKSLKIADDVYRRLGTGEFDSLPDSLLLSLFDIELIVPDAENEFETILKRNEVAVANTSVLQVVIQPSANCQLGCTYCGQVHRKQNATSDLSAKITRRIIQNAKRGAYNSVTAKWYGGEALMALSSIISMSKVLIDELTQLKISYTASMITNGLSLKPPVVRRLLLARCNHFQITLDGIAKTHDAMRPTKGGEPTFDIILRNIVDVTAMPEFEAASGVVAIRMNVNRTSGEEIPALIDLLASAGLQKRSILLEFQPVVDWGGNGAADGSYDHSEFARREIDWTIYALRRGFRMTGILPKRAFQPCMVVHPDGEVYDAEGNVYPCYEFPYTPTYENENYRFGRIETIENSRNEQAVTHQWFNDIRGGVSPCPRCNLFPVCGGGCPKKWLEGERACPPFKDNIHDRVVLSYLNRTSRLGDILLTPPASHGA